jgi:hypothetical protein
MVRYPVVRIPRPKEYMRVPDYILECVGFLGDVARGAEADSFNHDATAFFVTVPSEVEHGGDYHYLVTAKHNVRGGRRNIALLVNTSLGKDLAFPDNQPDQWYFHPTDSTTDIAVACFVPNPDWDITTIPITALLTDAEIKKRDIGVGDEVFFPGLFWNAVGAHKNTPILRMGNLAMFPNEPISVDYLSRWTTRMAPAELMEAYLVEARSIGGISGSPVFVKETLAIKARDRDGVLTQFQGASRFHLLGLMHGHWDVKESEINSPQIIPTARGVNFGIAVVVPANKILETINQPVLAEQRQHLDEKLRKLIAPTPD